MNINDPTRAISRIEKNFLLVFILSCFFHPSVFAQDSIDQFANSDSQNQGPVRSLEDTLQAHNPSVDSLKTEERIPKPHRPVTIVNPNRGKLDFYRGPLGDAEEEAKEKGPAESNSGGQSSSPEANNRTTNLRGELARLNQLKKERRQKTAAETLELKKEDLESEEAPETEDKTEELTDPRSLMLSEEDLKQEKKDPENSDLDGDGIPDQEDEDADGDGILDQQDLEIDEADTQSKQQQVLDTDGDGQSDSTDPDIDGDGIPNERDPDADGDGIPERKAGDVDLDGIPDELDPDIDGDGTPNVDDDDADGDGVPNEEE